MERNISVGLRPPGPPSLGFTTWDMSEDIWVPVVYFWNLLPLSCALCPPVPPPGQMPRSSQRPRPWSLAPLLPLS